MSTTTARFETHRLILETKLFPPPWREGLVRRPRLLRKLDAGLDKKLTLISAPAGFGKSTVLAEWIASPGLRQETVGWVSLDEGDNDPARFWAYFVNAVNQSCAELSVPQISDAQVFERTSDEVIVTTLVNAMSRSPRKVIVVLDDVHVIENSEIFAAFERMLNNAPPQFHLILTSRTDPPLPLARMRGRGELAELRASELRLNVVEIAKFVEHTLGVAISAGTAAAIDDRTEGWPAGLQLAALSMKDRSDLDEFIAGFSGNDQYVLDFLVDEVLERQPEYIRDFLLQTSILERMNGPLCDAVTGRTDGRKMLRFLERNNLFVFPLDRNRDWFRYHHLFAEVLRAHLLSERPAEPAELHRRAAVWFDHRDAADEAIEHAVAAGDHEAVATMLVHYSESFELTGRYVSVSRWSASLPDAMLRERPHLALLRASAAFRTAPNLEEARRLTSWAGDAITRIETAASALSSVEVNATIVGPDGLKALRGEWMALQLLHSSYQMSSEEMLTQAAMALELLPSGKHQLRATLHVLNAGVQMGVADLESAAPLLDRGIEEIRQTRNASALCGVLTHRGQLSAELGRLEEARTTFEEAVRTGQEASPESHWVVCGPYGALSGILLEQGNLEAAKQCVQRALDVLDSMPMRSTVLEVWGNAADVWLAAGEAELALAQLQAAEEYARGAKRFRHASYLSAIKLRYFCQTNAFDAAAALVRERKLSQNSVVDEKTIDELIAYGRYRILREAYSDASNLLRSVARFAKTTGRVTQEIRALASEAIALDQLGDQPLALAALGRATMLGEPGRFSYTFTMHGENMGSLLQELETACEANRDPGDVATLAYLSGLHRSCAGDSAPTGVAVASSSPQPFPLTSRETEILQLIAAGKKNQEIADMLFISVTTVKRHIANLYGKLDANSRTQAIAIARDRSIL